MNPPALQVSFTPILTLIQQAKARAFAAVNHELIDLYWRVGQYISQKTEHDGWGKNTVQQLAVWLATQEPEARGFSASNLWRMRQFFDAYQADPKLAPVVRELLWTHNLLILAKCKFRLEREFYLNMAGQHNG